MQADHHLDITGAVNCFLGNFESLSCLPFLTDAEMERLYGPEFAAALAELDLYNRQEKLCQKCTNRCCCLVKCEFYSPELSCCPVQSFRPALCRMHFCNQFAAAFGPLVKEIGDVFLESLLAAGKINGQKADLFDSPALGPLVPALVASISALLNAVKEGRLEEASARELIQTEIESYYKI
jgi:hypothetical protein